MKTQGVCDGLPAGADHCTRYGEKMCGEREEWVSSVSVNGHGLDRLKYEYSYSKFFVGNDRGAADEAPVATKTTNRCSYRQKGDYLTAAMPPRSGRPSSKATAIAWARDMTSSLAKIFSTWNRIVRSRTPRIVPISRFVFPVVIHNRTVSSRDDRV